MSTNNEKPTNEQNFEQETEHSIKGREMYRALKKANFKVNQNQYFGICSEIGKVDNLSPNRIAMINRNEEIIGAMNKLNADENVSESAFEVRKTAKVSTSLSLVNGTAMDIDKLEQEIADLKKTLANPNTNKMTRDETKKKLDTATEKLEKKYVELGTSTLDTIKAIGKFVPIISGWITEMVLLAKQLIKEGAGIITQHKKEIADAMEFMRQHTTSQSKSQLEELKEKGKKLAEKDERIAKIMDSGILDYSEDKETKEEVRENYTEYLKERAELKAMITELNRQLKEKALAEAKENNQEEFTYFVYSLEEGIKEVKETVDKASVATKVDPIVIDLNVDELLETTDVKNGVYFDMDNKGFKEKTAWISANDGLLVMDRNGDGLINSGAELFGDQNILMSGEVSSGGYMSLEELDEDKNLKIDAQDSKFNQIKVWRDKNQDGISTKDELFGLEELSIKAIHLENNVVNETDGNGNIIVRKGSYEKEDGSLGLMGEFLLSRNTIDSQISDHKKPELDNLQISEAIKSLPDIPSFGNVYSLRQAMALDQSGSLKNLVETFVNDSNPITRNNLMDEILFLWAESKEIEPTSRGRFIDARKLATVEAFMGRNFTGVDGANPIREAAAFLNNAYDQLKENFYIQFLLQSEYKDLKQKLIPSYSLERGMTSLSAEDAIKFLEHKISRNPGQKRKYLSDMSRMMRVLNNNSPENYRDFRSKVIEKGFMELFELDKESFLSKEYTDADDRIDGVYDIVFSGAGNDTVYGNAKDNILHGGKGNDSLLGGEGSDIYYFNLGDGKDTITEVNNKQDKNIVILGGGITKEDVTVRRVSLEDLEIKIKNTGDGIVIKKQVSDNPSIDALLFSNGETLKSSDISVASAIPTDEDDYLVLSESDDTVSLLQGNDVAYGKGGNDTIYGNEGDDQIIGGSGNDHLIGGTGNDLFLGEEGNDVYYYNIGDGADVIHDNAGLNVLVFGEGITKETIRLVRVDENDLDITFQNAEDKITVKTGVPNNVINKIKFADGTFLSNEEIKAISNRPTNLKDFLIGSAESDEIHALGGDDKILGKQGNDTLYGDDGDDLLHGNEGDDKLFGNQGKDILIGDDGNDILNGNEDDDKLYGAYGNDILYGMQGQDVLDGGFGDDILYGGEGDDILDADRHNDVLYGEGGNDTLKGGVGEDILDGGKGADTLDGGPGFDIFMFGMGSGQDTIQEYGDSVDKIKLTGTLKLQNLTFNRMEEDLVISIKGSDDTLTVKGQFVDVRHTIEEIEDSDGRKISFNEVLDLLNKQNGENLIQGAYTDDLLRGGEKGETIKGKAGNDQIFAEGGDDTVFGDDGDDYIVGGKGNDILNGGKGSDTFVFNRGDGKDQIIDLIGENSLRFGKGISKDSVKIFRMGTEDLKVNILGTEDEVILKNAVSKKVLNEIIFDDGTVLNYDEIQSSSREGSMFDDFLEGTENADEIYALGGDDTVYSGSGDDIVHGGEGNDKLYGQRGNDQLYGNEGNDVIHGAYDNDLIFGEQGNDVLLGNEGDDIVHGGDGDDTLYGDSEDSGERRHKISGNDTLIGGKGNDVLIGLLGDDEYIFARGEGSDTIQEELPWMEEQRNVISFKEGIAEDDLEFFRMNNDVVIRVFNSDKSGYDNEIAVKEGVQPSHSITTFKIPEIRFSDGKKWNREIIEEKLKTIKGTDQDDELRGFEWRDTLIGGRGNDTYILDRESSPDTIIENPGESNIIRMSKEYTTKNVHPLRIGDDLTIQSFYSEYTGSSDASLSNVNPNYGHIVKGRYHIVKDYYKNEMPNIQKIVFSDGTEWGNEKIDELAKHIYGTSYDDQVTGSDWNEIIYTSDGDDIIEGGKGDDVLDGSFGSDTYVFSRGDGEDIIENEKDYSNVEAIDTILFKGDIIKDDVKIRRDGNDLIVEVYAKDKISIDNKITIKDDFKYSNFRAIEKICFESGEELDKNEIYELAKYQYGTDGDDEIYLEHGDRIIEAGKGNDIINGSAGNTVYVFRLGDGRDTIQGEMEYVGLETTDTVLLKGDIRQELVKVKKKDYDLVIEVYSEDGKKLENEIIIKNEYLYTKPQIERVLFESDGSVWTSEQLKAKAAGMNGNPGNDNTGSDDNQGDAGEGNGNPGDHSNPPGNDNSQNPNEGMQDEEDGPDLVRGTENDDEIALQNGDFRVIGGRGDDKIVGSLGNSTYIFYRGDGKDTISGERDYSNYETIDTIRFKGDITEEDLTIRRTGRDLILEVRSKDKKRIDNKITVKDDFKYSNFRAIEKIEFSDGNFIDKQTIYERAHIIHGTSGDDEITLENGNFSVEAGRGNDIIAGSAGNTMYIFSRGDGEDIIKGEQDYSNLETIDTIKFKGDIVEDDIAIRKSGRDLIVEVYSKDKVSIDNKITVKDDFKYYNFRAIEKIEFGDGTVIDKKTIYERAESGGMSPANRFEEEMTTNLDLASVIENDTFVQKTTDQLFESLPDAPSQNGDFGGRRIALLVDSMNSFDLNHQVDWRNKAGQTQDINHSLGSEIWIKPD